MYSYFKETMLTCSISKSGAVSDLKHRFRVPGEEGEGWRGINVLSV